MSDDVDIISGRDLITALGAKLSHPGHLRFEFSEWIERAMDRVPELRQVIQSQKVLQLLGVPPDEFRRRTEAVAEFVPPGFRPMGSLKEVRAALMECEALAEQHLEFLEGHGLGFNFKAGLITIPSGGAPRRLPRSIVEALDEELRTETPKPSRSEKLERMRGFLEVIFGPEWVSSRLEKTYDNV